MSSRHLLAAMLARASQSGLGRSGLGTEYAYAYFRIVADDLPLDDITRRMGVAPTESWHRGSPGRFTRSRPHSGWCLRSRIPESNVVLSAHIRDVLDLLMPRADVVRALSASYRTWLVCVGTYTQSSPGLGLYANEVEALARLGVGLDCDLYLGDAARPTLTRSRFRTRG
jgi:hypothetical protein